MRKTTETIKDIKPDPKIVSMFSSVGKELRIVDKVDVVAHNFNISLNSSGRDQFTYQLSL